MGGPSSFFYKFYCDIIISHKNNQQLLKGGWTIYELNFLYLLRSIFFCA